jgi:hypothetical protein
MSNDFMPQTYLDTQICPKSIQNTEGENEM